MTSLARSAWRELFSPLFRRPSVVQLAALCYRMDGPELEVLLVQSSRGRWILPKGWPIDGLGGGETAKQEAWEEAGVSEGKLAKRSLGFFDTVKRLDNGTEMPCQTYVYPIDVREIQTEYPEAGQRDRKWVTFDLAQEMVDESGLKDILANFAASYPNKH